MAPWIGKWGLSGLALMYGLESMAVPVPIEFPFVLSGLLLHADGHRYVVLVLVTWLTSSAGNMAAFALARRSGRHLWPRMGRFLAPALILRFEKWVNRYGIAAVVFTRWINWGFGISIQRPDSLGGSSS